MRVTIDSDDEPEWKRLAKYFNMRHICGVDEIRVSSGGGAGLHLIKRGLEISMQQSLDIRALLGEDSTRLLYDEILDHKPKQILWRMKKSSRSPQKPSGTAGRSGVLSPPINGNGRRRKARTITERDLLALPWFSGVPRGAYVRGGRR